MVAFRHFQFQSYQHLEAGKGLDAMNKEEAKAALSEFVGLPKCMDCGWKLDTHITNHCSCGGPVNAEDKKIYETAFARARELQKIIYS